MTVSLVRPLLIGLVGIAMGAGPAASRPAHAGPWTEGLKGSIKRRFAQQGEVAALSAAERTALQKLWRELDDLTLKAIERRYGSHITMKRLAEAARSPATIVERDAYEQYLRRHSPNLSDAERQEVLGYFTGQRAYVNGNHVQIPITVAHERLHQVSHPRFRETFGGDLDEGMTEHFARGIHNDLALHDMPKVYPVQQRLVSKLAARAGEEPLAKAYFQGEIGALQNQLDTDLGPGAFREFTLALRRQDLGRAESLLSGRVTLQ